MEKVWWTAWFLASAGLLFSLPEGGVEATAEQGRLTQLGSWWSPDKGWEGRWWWKETGGGSAWVRAGVFQAGPLMLSPGTEGWRTWSVGPQLSSGNWGVGVDGGSWGVWAVQNPEKLEGGMQNRWGTRPWALAAGADRSWALDLPVPETGPWIDRGRGGLLFDGGATRAGVEATAVVPSVGPRGWRTRARADTESGPWSLAVQGSGGEDPTSTDFEPWAAHGEIGWRPWTVGWEGDASDSAGQGRLGVRAGGSGVSVAWGPEAGWNTLARAEVRTLVTLGADTSVSYRQEHWSGEGGVSAQGRFEKGRWSASWALVSGEEPRQTVTATWKEASLEAEADWKVEGFRLGWIGPGTSFELTLRWLF